MQVQTGLDQQAGRAEERNHQGRNRQASQHGDFRKTGISRERSSWMIFFSTSVVDIKNFGLRWDGQRFCDLLHGDILRALCGSEQIGRARFQGFPRLNVRKPPQRAAGTHADGFGKSGIRTEPAPWRRAVNAKAGGKLDVRNKSDRHFAAFRWMPPHS